MKKSDKVKSDLTDRVRMLVKYMAARNSSIDQASFIAGMAAAAEALTADPHSQPERADKLLEACKACASEMGIAIFFARS